MKIKILTNNIMIDYKKVDKGTVIDVSDLIAKRYVDIGQAEMLDKANNIEPLKVLVNGAEVDLNTLTIKELAELSVTLNLDVNQESKESKANFAKRIFDEINNKNKE